MTLGNSRSFGPSPDWAYDDRGAPPQEINAPTWDCPEGSCQCSEHASEAREEYEFSVMLFSHKGERMPGGRCRIIHNGRVINHEQPYADPSGWVTSAIPGSSTTVLVEWAPATMPDDPQSPYRTWYYVDVQQDLPETARRKLHNLGYSRSASLIENIRAFRNDFTPESTSEDLADINADLVLYHDKACAPPYRSSSGLTLVDIMEFKHLDKPQHPQTPPHSTGRPTVGQGSVRVIRPIVELYKENGEWAPGDVKPYGRRNSIWRLDIPRGSHSAVTFVGAEGVEIKSNNPDNAVPNDPEVWIDADPTAHRRTIFFYGRRSPQTNHGMDHCALIGPPGGPAFLQVWVRDYKDTGTKPGAFKKHFVSIWLASTSVALNSNDFLEKSHYNLDINIKVGKYNNQTREKSRSENDPLIETPNQIWAALEARVFSRVPKIEKIEHLVINSHGGVGREGGFLYLGRDPTLSRLDGALADIGFSKDNMEWWNKLRGKVEHIWLHGCVIGSDDVFCSDIAKRTGAWVFAPGYYTGFPPNLKRGHIEHLWDNQPKYWRPTDGRLVIAEEFFRHARRKPRVPGQKSTLRFNIIERLGPFPTGKR